MRKNEIGERTTPYKDKGLYNNIVSKYKYYLKSRNNKNLPAYWRKYRMWEDTHYWDDRGGIGVRLAKFQSNKLYETTRVLESAMTTGTPKPNIEPDMRYITPDEIDAAKEFAVGLRREMMRIWDAANMKNVLKRAIIEYGTVGTGLVNVPVNPLTGEIEPQNDDVFTFLPDPSMPCVDRIKDFPYIRAVVMTVERIQEVYGVDVEPQGTVSTLNDALMDGEPESILGKAKAFVSGLSDGSKVKKGLGGGCIVIELHTPDSEVEEYEQDEYDDEGIVAKDDDGKPKRHVAKRPKYPYGRIITVVIGYDDWIIQDIACPYKYSEYLVMSNEPKLGEIFGRSEGQHIEPHIKAINQLISNAIDNTEYFGNPIMEVVEDLIANPDRVYENEPGEKIAVRRAGAVNLVVPNPVGSFVYELFGLLKQDADVIQGISDSFRGFQSSSSSSGEKEKALIMQSGGRIQPKVDDVKDFAENFYRHLAHVLINLPFEQEIYQPVEEKIGDGIDYYRFVPSEGRNYSFNITVDTNSMLPIDKNLRFQEGMELFKVNAISLEHLIDLAPTLEDKQRAKDFVKSQKDQQQGQQQELTPEDIKGAKEQIFSIADEDERYKTLESAYNDNPDAIMQVIMSDPSLLEDRAVIALVQMHPEIGQAVQGQ